MRELNGARIGQLLRVKGTVTRTSEVRPELLVGTFRCNECLGLERSIEQQFKYTEPSICSNSLCNNRTRWTLVPELSKFANWQRVRLQEDAEELPPGSMPRTLDIIVRNDVVEKAKPGDKCFFTGVLIVVPDVSTMMLPTNRLERGGEFDPSARRREADGVAGLKALGVRELTHKLAFLALYVDWGDTQHNLLV
jgi:DNA replication licensing factor MCM6